MKRYVKKNYGINSVQVDFNSPIAKKHFFSLRDRFASENSKLLEEAREEQVRLARKRGMRRGIGNYFKAHPKFGKALGEHNDELKRKTS